MYGPPQPGPAAQHAGAQGEPALVPGTRVSSCGADGIHYMGSVTHVQGGMIHVAWGNGQQSWTAPNQVTVLGPPKVKRRTAGCGFAIAAIVVGLVGAVQVLMGGQRVSHETILTYAGVAVALGFVALIRRATRRPEPQR